MLSLVRIVYKRHASDTSILKTYATEPAADVIAIFVTFLCEMKQYTIRAMMTIAPALNSSAPITIPAIAPTDNPSSSLNVGTSTNKIILGQALDIR